VPFGGFDKGRSPCNIPDSFVGVRRGLPLSKETLGTTVPPGQWSGHSNGISMTDEERLTGSANQQRAPMEADPLCYGTRFENEHCIHGEIMETVNGLEPG